MIAWVDASVGLAGDMLLAALVDAGARPEAIEAGLRTLGLPAWQLQFHEVKRGAFRALRAEVTVRGLPADAAFDPGAAFVPARAPANRVSLVADHAHHPWRELRATIARAGLPDRVKQRALAAYGRLAEAEAALHGMPVDDVELHEVGATDAIVDIVGVCLALEDLGIDALFASPLPMGTGAVTAAHGQIPLPAPATLGVLQGWPVVPARWPGEWVTPTGAALVAALAKPGGLPAMTLRRTGHGAGKRDPREVANLVRVVLGDAPATATEAQAVVELCCNVDDMPGEWVPPVIDSLLAAGALDAWTVAIGMKKGRPAWQLCALATPADADRLADHLLRHTTTFGVRRTAWARTTLERSVDTVQTPFGPIRVKLGGRGGEVWHAAPEYADVAAAATQAGVPVGEVHAAALAAWSRR